jgi:hypothetical protein
MAHPNAPGGDQPPHPADEQPRRNVPAPVVPGPSPAVPVAAGETSSSAIAAREKAAVEARFLYAMHNRRNFDESRIRLMQSCKRPRFAEVARYSKPVGNERVTGLSIRFAEEARLQWRNLDVTTMIVFDDEERRIYRVVGTDLESNATDSVDVLVEKFVERRSPGDRDIISQRMNKRNQLVYRLVATEDEVFVKANNMIAKARRNVILALLPADLKDECEETILTALENEGATDPDGARKRVTELFFKLGIMPQQIADLLGHSLDGMTPAELTLLRSYHTAMKEGDATWTDIMEAHGRGGTKPAAAGASTSTEAPKRGTEGLKSSLKGKAEPSPAARAALEELDRVESDIRSGASASTEEKAGNVCTKCGGKNGNHKPDCPYYAD